MKKLLLTSLLMTSVAFPLLASADNHTVSLGYAQSKVQDFKDIKGVNLKYRYEWDSPVSIIGSFTYMSGDENYNYSDIDEQFDAKTKVKYYSLAAGPAYRVNDYISIYGLIGLNYNKIDYYESWSFYGSNGNYSNNENKSSFMYGAGLQINPLSNVAIDIGYEGSSVSSGGKSHSINGFNICVGYRF